MLNKAAIKKNLEKVYNYFFNGLYFNSQIKFFEVEEFNGSSFRSSANYVSVIFGNVPHQLEDCSLSNSVISISGDNVLIHIEDTARYFIRGKNEVIVEAYPGAKDDAVRLYIFSIVLGVLLHKHDILALHSSAIKVGDGVVIIAGQSGVGKSTLALGLYRKGYEILNDDISSIFFNEAGNPFVHNGVCHLKLWARSLEKYGYEASSFGKLRDELEKYSFPLTRLNTIPLPLKAVFFIKEVNENLLENAEVKGLEKFKIIKANTYRYKLVEHLHKTAAHFISSTNLANQVPFIKVSRSKDTQPADFSNYMEEQFRKL